MSPPLVLFHAVLNVAQVVVGVTCFYEIFCYLRRFTMDPSFLNRWKIKDGDGCDLANKLISALFSTSCTVTGVILTNSHEVWSPWMLYYMYIVAASYFLYDILSMYRVYLCRSEFDVNSPLFFEFFFRKRPLIVTHHLLLATLFIPILMYVKHDPPGQLLIGFALLMESSTPFVCMRAILSLLGLKNTRLYLINGFAMVVIFFLCRIAIYPLFFWKFAQQQHITVTEAIFDVTPVICKICTFSCFLPQVYWWILMVKGAVQVVKNHKNE